jgi:tetratricopeptide (TPR) repeat protein
VPGWHDATRALQRDGKIRMVGIVQEQHPDRARLFMQWKQMDWPVMVDALNLLEVEVVPITLLIDERGIVTDVASRRIAIDEQIAEFLARPAVDADSETAPPQTAPDLDALRRAATSGEAAALAYADALTLWGGDERLAEAIAAYERIVATSPADAAARFRLGVARRNLYESQAGQAADFARAVEQWSAALELDPNNYIWRRRIQQFGPRLEKPYPFYDWVDAARTEIAERGKTPVALRVEPVGAELASPAELFMAAKATDDEPDPRDRIHRDDGKYVEIDATTVPPAIAPGASARVHVELRPNVKNAAHWNNEARGLVFWIDPPEGWQVDQRKIELPLPGSALSDEPRRVEFEVKNSGAQEAARRLDAYALYYVCEGTDGPCLFRRSDVAIDLPLAR